MVPKPGGSAAALAGTKPKLLRDMRRTLHFHFNPNAPVDVELDRLLQWGKTLGVAMLIEFDREIFISDFGRDLTNPSTKGNGRKIMSALLGLAAHTGIVVETSYMTEEMKLGAYYRTFVLDRKSVDSGTSRPEPLLP